MKVKDIINKLKQYDEDLVIDIHICPEDSTYVSIGFDEITFSEKIQSFMIWKDWKPIWSRIDNSFDEAVENTKNWENIKRRKILVLSFDY